MRKLTGIMATALLWLGAAGSAAGVCGSGPPLPPDGLLWPLAGEVVSDWTLDCDSDRGHRGVDISADTGSPVRAAAGGRVIFAGYTPAEGGGTTISIEHPGGLRSTYLHIENPAVVKGDEVSGGQAIGYIGDQPLHFGLKLPGSRDTYFNPLELIGPLPSAAGGPAVLEAASAALAESAAPLPAPTSAPAENIQAAAPGSPAPAAASTAAASPATSPAGQTAPMLPPAPGYRPATVMLSPVAEIYAGGLSKGGAERQISPAPAAAAGTALPALKEAAVFDERRDRRSSAGARPAVAFMALLSGALAAARFTAGWNRAPASAQPMAPC